VTESTIPKRYVVVGAGGTGGWLSAGLARIVQYQQPGSVLLLVDGDSFEPKNAERQDFTQLGNKAQVRAAELQPHFPDVFIVPDSRWVVQNPPANPEADSVAASDLLRENDVVYAVVDNFSARKVIFDAAREFDNIDVFTGGNDDALFGSIYHYQRRDGKDITDHPSEMHPELIDPPDRNPGELSCHERAKLKGGTQTLAANMAVASYLLGRTCKVILDGEEDMESEIMFDIGAGVAGAYDRRAEILVPIQ
jgi:molybdopterin/thiamine biosynthesis adenylyltransferase